jgi:sister-chromatid-cohesion protein PDS5
MSDRQYRSRSLQALHIELAALDQDTVDAKSLDKVREKLVNASLLLGKDKGVKAYTCCCLADLLRLYAPDCPYEEKELKVGQ